APVKPQAAFCRKCGAALKPGVKFCTQCGAQRMDVSEM
ncbi:MAG: zinc ribbon domain-containing protein, partial [Clostridia bacterium]|nr:zinc ribbon domain-containing protein [Clostridia bacterium]